jgi:hypothetical protein
MGRMGRKQERNEGSKSAGAHLHLVQRLRMRGAIPPLSQYFFMVWYSVKHDNNFNFIYY